MPVKNSNALNPNVFGRCIPIKATRLLPTTSWVRYSEKEILEKNAITGWRFNGNIKRASAVRPAAIGSHPAPYKPMAVTATPYI